jgi:hypothetical protein
VNSPSWTAHGASEQNADPVESLKATGYAFLQPGQLSSILGVDLAQLSALHDAWRDLPRDQYLRDGGRYRSRRHACFVQELAPASVDARLELCAPRAHWQPTSYNALHGGLERWFEPIAPQVVESRAWRRLLSGLGSIFAQVRPVSRWFLEAHQFRIDTTGGIGRPTPEGAHRDGVDFVAVVMVQRRNLRGGETRVFDANGISGVRFTMHEPWSALLLDDARVIHETTPIQPDGGGGARDTLVLTYRAGGFQSPDRV